MQSRLSAIVSYLFWIGREMCSIVKDGTKLFPLFFFFFFFSSTKIKTVWINSKFQDSFIVDIPSCVARFEREKVKEGRGRGKKVKEKKEKNIGGNTIDAISKLPPSARTRPRVYNTIIPSIFNLTGSRCALRIYIYIHTIRRNINPI